MTTRFVLDLAIELAIELEIEIGADGTALAVELASATATSIPGPDSASSYGDGFMYLATGSRDYEMWKTECPDLFP